MSDVPNVVRVSLEALCQSGVGIVAAFEVGSRCWGASAPDSDHDVVAITISPLSDYISLDPPAASYDFIKNRAMSLTVWDIRRAVELVAFGSPAPGQFLRWAPHYVREEAFATPLLEFAEKNISPHRAIDTWVKEARQAQRKIEQHAEQIEAKRYVQILRPLLAARAIRLGGVRGSYPMAKVQGLAEVSEAPKPVRDLLRNVVNLRQAGVDVVMSRSDVVDAFCADEMADVLSYRQMLGEIPDRSCVRHDGSQLLKSIFEDFSEFVPTLPCANL